MILVSLQQLDETVSHTKQSIWKQIASRKQESKDLKYLPIEQTQHNRRLDIARRLNTEVLFYSPEENNQNAHPKKTIGLSQAAAAR